MTKPVVKASPSSLATSSTNPHTEPRSTAFPPGGDGEQPAEARPRAPATDAFKPCAELASRPLFSGQQRPHRTVTRGMFSISVSEESPKQGNSGPKEVLIGPSGSRAVLWGAGHAAPPKACRWPCSSHPSQDRKAREAEVMAEFAGR